jgi:hypothetical protein
MPHGHRSISQLPTFEKVSLLTQSEQRARPSTSIALVGMAGWFWASHRIVKGNFTAEAERSLTQAAQEYTVAKVWLAIGLSARGDIANARDHLRTYVAEIGNARSNFAINLLQDIESAGQGR